jgi:two-component system, chemotaxis family, protein-glutamate methylesterase/glutaminase
MTSKKIKTLIVDDSAVVRQVLSEILRSDRDIEIIAAASDPLIAMQYMQRQWPDVIVLDLEMPRMDGLTFLKKIMSEHPTPVVVCSSLAEKGATITVQVLAAGAVDVVTKPKLGVHGFLYDNKNNLIDVVKAAARANVRILKRHADAANTPPPPAPKLSVDVMLAPPKMLGSLKFNTDRIIGIGASTGGTQAIEHILKSLPTQCPGIVIVQHMPAGFTKAFADRLNSICQIEVKEAEPNDRVQQGRAIIAPGDRHMLLKRQGNQYSIDLKDGPLINRHRPSVDVLFRSMAQNAGRNAVGVILTGMGDDGARGLDEMHQAGAFCIAQNEETCVVYGMPKEAVKRGAADAVLPIDTIAQHLLKAELP